MKELNNMDLEQVAAGKGGQIAQQSGGGTSLFLSQSAAPSIINKNVSVVGGARVGRVGRGRSIKIR